MWTMCPAQLRATLVRGAGAGSPSFGRCLPWIRGCRTCAAGVCVRPCWCAHGGGGNSSHTSKIILIFISALWLTFKKKQNMSSCPVSDSVPADVECEVFYVAKCSDLKHLPISLFFLFDCCSILETS